MLDMNMDRLRGLLVERHVTQDELAVALGINRSTLYRKISEGGKRFTADEIFKMKDFIPLSDQEVIDIFLTKKVALTRQREAI
ncbi:helix-turn-helix transcriptional regulator [Lactiplantibacillus paraxiangfangensis]|uniref:helix-turn-helix domain-containing protein n=1 Tax=Lactiplantibacillus paraxiangfangensis TaxID=3076224 RepID=UPI0030C7022C